MIILRNKSVSSYPMPPMRDARRMMGKFTDNLRNLVVSYAAVYNRMMTMMMLFGFEGPGCLR